MIAEGLTEPEILIGQRCFGDAQRLLGEGLRGQAVGTYTVGWHDTNVQPYRGCFAVVSETDPDLAELVGEVLRVNARDLGVLVYVLGREDVPHSISLARRAFLAISGLYRDDVFGVVWRMG